MNRAVLRRKYEKETGKHWKKWNSKASPTIEYSKWLENIIVAQAEVKNNVGLGGVSQQRELLAISCLKNIVEPISYLRELAEVDGGKLDGSYAMHLTKQGMFYQNLAKEALREIDNCG